MTTGSRAYINVAHTIFFPVEESVDFDTSDIDEITIKLTKESDASVIVEFKLSTVEIEVVSPQLLKLHIRANKVTVAGNYEISFSWTDKSGQPHRGTPTESEIIRFYS